MMRSLLSLAVFSSAVALSACKQKEVDPGPPSLGSVLVPAPQAAPSGNLPSAPNLPSDEDVPTEEDFEDEVNRTITSKNLNEELDKLEREIGGSL